MYRVFASGVLAVVAGARAAPGSDGGRACLQVATAFSVDTVDIGEPGQAVGLKVLKNNATGESVDIAYTFGGKVDSVRLRSPVTKQVRELLLSSERNASRLINMGHGVNEMLLPFANRISNGTYELDGTTYYMERNNQMPSADNAIHGFLRGKSMQVLKERRCADHASVTLAYVFNNASDAQSQPQGYPFHLSVEVTYTLDAQGVSITTAVKNRAEQGGPLPFYMGMHPYFKVQDLSASSVVFDRCSGWNQIEVNENMIPTGATKPFSGFRGEPIGGSLERPTQWDNGFKATASSAECPELKTEVFDPTVGDSSVLWLSPNFKWLQVFTGGAPLLGQVVAIEPMSGQTDAYNNGQAKELLLQAGESWQGTFGFMLSAPSEAARRQGK